MIRDSSPTRKCGGSAHPKRDRQRARSDIPALLAARHSNPSIARVLKYSNNTRVGASADSVIGPRLTRTMLKT